MRPRRRAHLIRRHLDEPDAQHARRRDRLARQLDAARRAARAAGGEHRAALLALADRVVLGGVFRAQQLGDDNRMDPESVADDVRALGRDAQTFAGSDAIAEYLSAEAKPGDLLLIMSNGSFDGLCDKLVKKLDRGVPTEAPAR